MKRRQLLALLTAAPLLVASGPTRAVIPVVDVAAIQSLIQQISAWNQQLRAMQLQLTQLQQTRSALTGQRGMERLLRQTPVDRNYLPRDWTVAAGIGAGAPPIYAGLAGSARAQMRANAVLSPAEFARLPGPVTDLLADERRGVAAGQTLTRAAYARSSDRFAALGALIDRIGTAADAKAIAELQGRIGAEQAMLTNEGLKLTALAQVADADRAARELARRETVARNHGTFGLRFEPTPPVP